MTGLSGFKEARYRGRANIDTWLGDLPSGWGPVRLKQVARLYSGHTPSRQEASYWENCTIPWFGLADVWQIRDGKAKFVTETAEKISELGLANSAARLLPAGTVILSRTASVGFAAVLGVPMATTQDFVNWVCGASLLPDYLLWVFRAMAPEFKRLTMGSTHQTIYMPDVGRFETPLPPINRQRAIADFLDRETAKIDALIAKKERLFELLDEKRTALITHAVTKGLDPDAPMKESGVEWLGTIPAHWRVSPLMRLTPDDRQIMYGIVLPGPDFQGGVPIVKGGDVSPDRLKLESLNRTDPEIEKGYERSRLRGGDIVYAIRGSIGAAALVPVELEGVNLTQDAARIAPRQGVVGPWLLLAVQSNAVFSQLDAKASGATIRGINIRDLKRAIVPVPPAAEQGAIAAVVEGELARTRGVRSRAVAAIERLREYRSALISGVVTGKVSVG